MLLKKTRDANSASKPCKCDRTLKKTTNMRAAALAQSQMARYEAIRRTNRRLTFSGEALLLSIGRLSYIGRKEPVGGHRGHQYLVLPCEQ